MLIHLVKIYFRAKVNNFFISRNNYLQPQRMEKFILFNIVDKIINEYEISEEFVCSTSMCVRRTIPEQQF